MKQLALFYNFSEERLRKAKFALLPLKISVKAVDVSDFGQPVGYLAGIKGIEPLDNQYDGDGFEDEMIVLCGFNGRTIEAFIRVLNKCGVGRVPLKAVITDTNKTWNSVKLHEAVSADHQQMSSQQP